MITNARLAQHLQSYVHPVDGSAMLTAVRASDTGGDPDAIAWKSVTGRTGLTYDGGGLPGSGTVKTFGAGF